MSSGRFGDGSAAGKGLASSSLSNLEPIGETPRPTPAWASSIASMPLW